MESATATPEDVLIGKTFYSGDKELKIGTSADTSVVCRILTISISSSTSYVGFQVIENNSIKSNWNMRSDDHTVREGILAKCWWLHATFYVEFLENVSVSDKMSLFTSYDKGDTLSWDYTDNHNIIIVKR